MFRYLAMLWNGDVESQQESADALTRRLRLTSPALISVFEGKGVRVLAAGGVSGASGALLLPDRGGVVLGTLFERSNSDRQIAIPKPAKFSSDQCTEIIRSSGRVLMHSYWGRYVAVLASRTSSAKHIVKDPTGNLPCFLTHFHGITVAFSCISDCASTGLFHFKINWQYLANRVAVGPCQSNDTALDGVSEIYGGEALTVQDMSLKREFYWLPTRIAESSTLDDAQLAASTLYGAAKSTAHAWGSSHPRLLLRASGGLDSSIVLGCLADAPSKPHITCLTYYVSGSASDERVFARLSVRKAGCEHLEHARSSEVNFEHLLEMTPTVNPPTSLAFIESTRVEREIARARQITAICTGDGGDALLGSVTRSQAATEYLVRAGLDPRFFIIAAQVAKLTNKSIWAVISAAVKKRVVGWNARFLDQLAALIVCERKLIAGDLRAQVSRERFCPHPWFANAEGTSPNILLPILAVSQPRRFCDPLSRPDDCDPEFVYPLFSQPLVETCLRIPSYIHLADGRDRGLARRAFENDLPSEIARRQWKDRGVGSAEQALQRNIKFARELILEGELVRRGYLSKSALENALVNEPSRQAAYTMELFDYLAVEAWLRPWLEGRQRVAA